MMPHIFTQTCIYTYICINTHVYYNSMVTLVAATYTHTQELYVLFIQVGWDANTEVRYITLVYMQSAGYSHTGARSRAKSPLGVNTTSSGWEQLSTHEHQISEGFGASVQVLSLRTSLRNSQRLVMVNTLFNPHTTAPATLSKTHAPHSAFPFLIWGPAKPIPQTQISARTQTTGSQCVMCP